MDAQELKVTELIKKRIHELDPDARIILFGSRARGDSGINSDWDILILVDQYPVDRVSEQIYREVIFDIELETGEPISIFVFSKKDWESRHTITPLYRNVRKEGVLL